MTRMLTHAEVSKKYEQRLLQALDAVVVHKGFPLGEESSKELLASIVTEVALDGWTCGVAYGPEKTLGIIFKPLSPEEYARVLWARDSDNVRLEMDSVTYATVPDGAAGKPAELAAMSDRELLAHFAEKFKEYSGAVDAEQEFMEDNPVRDAWDDDQRARHSELVEDTRDAYDEIAHIINHIADARNHR